MSGIDHPARRLTALVAVFGVFDVTLVWYIIHWVVR
jgi:phage shock protein PspC (stress-responsive transcriptional regulator)